MNNIVRKKMVLAMEFIAQHINDEEVLNGWLMGGIPDGDIEYGSFDVEDVEDWYIKDDSFEDLMKCFLRSMARAKKSGGLYCDKVVANVE